MAEAELKLAPDGLLARVAPPWSEEKLEILHGYLNGGSGNQGGFARACKKAGGWYGLDLFAGSGLNISKTTDQPVDGSPIIALKAGTPQALEVIAAEKHDDMCEALKLRTAPFGNRAHVLQSDSNRAINEMLARVPKAAPAFAFIDPEGADVDWCTVEAIANHKSKPNLIEQLILLPVDMGFVRLIRDYPDRVTKIYGHDEWKAIAERRAAGKISADQARGEYVRLYANGLKQLGYKHVIDRQVLKPNGHPLYFLIFATGHNAGLKIMEHVFTQVKFVVEEVLGQEQLFNPGPRTYRKTRLRD